MNSGPVSGRDTYFEETCCGIGADEHGEVVKFEDSDGVAVGNATPASRAAMMNAARSMWG
jgi:hypothetical protein